MKIIVVVAVAAAVVVAVAVVVKQIGGWSSGRPQKLNFGPILFPIFRHA